MGVVEPRKVSRRNRRAWWARFTFNGITRYDQGAYSLVGGVAEGFCVAVELSDAEREELLELCRQRLDAFRMQRASAAMPASDGRREAGCGFCALEDSGRVLLEYALEAVHRRCRCGDS